MKNINLFKIANIIAIVLVFAFMFSSVALAQDFRVPNAPGNLPNDTNVTQLLLRIIQILLAIAGLIAVLFLIVGGFRYITAAGNEETAEAGKKTIINSIIGIVIIILSFVIVRVVSNALINNQTQ